MKIYDLIDLYFELCGTNMLHKKQIIHTIYNEVTASGKQGSSNVNNMFCALECSFHTEVHFTLLSGQNLVLKGYSVDSKKEKRKTKLFAEFYKL